MKAPKNRLKAERKGAIEEKVRGFPVAREALPD